MDVSGVVPFHSSVWYSYSIVNRCCVRHAGQYAGQKTDRDQTENRVRYESLGDVQSLVLQVLVVVSRDPQPATASVIISS